MQVRVVGFVPPILGTEGEFNTFRLGGFYTKHLSPGDRVYLLNEKEKLVFGLAEVLKLESGQLWELCQAHAHTNHTELGRACADSPQRLFALLQKFYGPHIALPAKKAVVLFMRRLE